MAYVICQVVVRFLSALLQKLADAGRACLYALHEREKATRLRGFLFAGCNDQAGLVRVGRRLQHGFFQLGKGFQYKFGQFVEVG